MNMADQHHVIRLNRLGTEPAQMRPELVDEPRRGPSRFSSRRLALVLVAVLVLGACIGAAMRLAPAQEQRVTVSGIGTGPTTLTLAEVVAAVGMHLLVPTDETPTMAAVSDLAPLEDQAFFAHASVGDIVLIYPKSQRAILYSPKLGKILEVAPLTLTQ